MSWTEGRIHSFIVSALRAATRRWPPRYETMNEAKTEKRINEKTGRLAQHYECAACRLDFPQKDVQVNHKEAVVSPEEGFISWDVFIERLFCSKDKLEVLCKPCHKACTKLENEVRKQCLLAKKSSSQEEVPSPSKVKSRKKNTTTSSKKD